METQDTPPPKKRSGCLQLALILGVPFVLFGLVMVWYTDTEGFKADYEAKQATQEAVAAATQAAQPPPTATPIPFGAVERVVCRDFRSIMSDVRAGVLTTAELRRRLQDLRRDTEISENPAINQHGDAMLRGITHGDIDEYTDAVARFHTVCLRHDQ